MRRQGYTIIEVMAAMLILGLAFTALFQGTSIIRKAQAQAAQRVQEGRTGDGIRSALVRLLAQPGVPGTAVSDRLSGTATGLTIQCTAGPCTLGVASAGSEGRLISEHAGQRIERPLWGVSKPALRYLTTDGAFDHWPVSVGSQARLVAIAVVDEGADASPVATVRLWSQQPQDCNFDSISAQCRPPLS